MSTDYRAWFEKADTEETLLSLQLLCDVNDPLPELQEIQRSIMHIHAMLAIHRVRLMGCDVTRSGRAFLVSAPIPKRG